jgi:hypothetical protein
MRWSRFIYELHRFLTAKRKEIFDLSQIFHTKKLGNGDGMNSVFLD